MSRGSSPPSERFPLPRRAPFVAIASVAVVATLTLVVWPRVQRWRSEHRVADSAATLGACLAGSVDASGDRLGDERLRQRAIAADLRGEDWPGRCMLHATELMVVLEGLAKGARRCEGACCVDDEACIRHDSALALVARARDQLARRRFDGDVMAALYAALPHDGAPTALAPAPEPARRPRPEAPLLDVAIDQSGLAAGPDGRWRLLMHARRRRLVMCDVDPERAEARCQPVAPSVPIADSVLMVDGSRAESPHVLARHADDDPRWSVFDASNGSAALSLRHDPYGVSVLTDGYVVALVRDGETYRLIGSDGSQHDIDGAWSAALGPPLLFGDTLVWPERRAQDMVVRAMTLSREGPSAPVDAATFSGWQPSAVALSACLLEDGLALMATEGERAAIAFRQGERWSVASAHIGIDASRSGMTCERRGVALSSIEEGDPSPPGDASRKRYRIQRQRCTLAGCSGDEASADIARISRASRYLLGSIGERVALIWQSPLGDVRSLSARPAELATTPAQSLIDDAELPSFDWDAQVEMLAQGDHALLLVTATHADARATFGYVLGLGGARALRIVR